MQITGIRCRKIPRYNKVFKFNSELQIGHVLTVSGAPLKSLAGKREKES